MADKNVDYFEPLFILFLKEYKTMAFYNISNNNIITINNKNRMYVDFMWIFNV